VTEAQKSLEDASIECKRLARILAKGPRAVRSQDERQVAKATAYAWFNTHRHTVIPSIGQGRLQSIDDDYRKLLDLSARESARTIYLKTLKDLDRAISTLQSELVVQLSGPSIKPTTTADVAPDFSKLVSDTTMQSILVRRWNECVACVKAKAPLAATVMMGGLLEGLLLAKINQLSDQSVVFKAKTAPRDKASKTLPLKEWGLKNYIDVAHELGWISQTTKDVGVVMRDYRNFIHPQKELSHGIQLHTQDAEMMWEIAKNVTHQLL
jgi:hypothetical protein